MSNHDRHVLDLEASPDGIELFAEELPRDQHVNRMMSRCCYGSVSTVGTASSCASSVSTLSSGCG